MRGLPPIAPAGQLPTGDDTLGRRLTQRKMRVPSLVARGVGTFLIWLLILMLLAITIVPAFLDRFYYEGPASSHFDGARFFNPAGEPIPGLSGPRGGVLTRFIPGGAMRPPRPQRVAVQPIDP